MRQVGLPIADATRVLGISLPDNIIALALNSSNAADLAPSDFRFSKGSCSGKARTQDAPRERYYLRASAPIRPPSYVAQQAARSCHRAGSAERFLDCFVAYAPRNDELRKAPHSRLPCWSTSRPERPPRSRPRSG